MLLRPIVSPVLLLAIGALLLLLGSAAAATNGTATEETPERSRTPTRSRSLSSQIEVAPSRTLTNTTAAEAEDERAQSSASTRWQRFRDWWTQDRIIIISVCGGVFVLLLIAVGVVVKKSRAAGRVIGVHYLDEGGKWAIELPAPPPSACVSAQKGDDEDGAASPPGPGVAAAAATAVPAPATAADGTAGGGPAEAPSPPVVSHWGDLAPNVRAQVFLNDPVAVARDLSDMSIVVAKRDGTAHDPMGRSEGNFRDRNAFVYHTLCRLATLVGEEATVGAHFASKWSLTVAPDDAADISQQLVQLFRSDNVVVAGVDGDDPSSVARASRTFLVLRALHRGVIGALVDAVRGALHLPSVPPSTFNAGPPTIDIAPMVGTSHIIVTFSFASTSAPGGTDPQGIETVGGAPAFTAEWSARIELDVSVAECSDTRGVVSVAASVETITFKPLAADAPEAARDEWRNRVREVQQQVENILGQGSVRFVDVPA